MEGAIVGKVFPIKPKKTSITTKILFIMVLTNPNDIFIKKMNCKTCFCECH